MSPVSSWTHPDTVYYLDATPEQLDDGNGILCEILGKRLSLNMYAEYLVSWKGTDKHGNPWPLWIIPECNLTAEQVEIFEEGDEDSQPATASYHKQILKLSTYTKAYVDGNQTYSSVIDLLLKNHADATCLQGLTADDGDDHKVSMLLEIFAGQEQKIFRTLLAGSIQRRKYADPEFRKLLRTYQGNYSRLPGKGHPCIYHFEHTDDKGYPPTIAEAFEILKHINRYIQDVNYAMAVDRNTVDQDVEDNNANDQDDEEDAGTQFDKQWYQAKKYNRLAFVVNGKTSPRRLEVLKAWYKKTYQYLWTASKGNIKCQDYMPRAWCEDGYAANAIRRFEQHRRETSTNYLMALISKISRHEFGKKWQFRPEIVFFCFGEFHAAIAELAITAISGAHWDSGHGVSHFEAGRSNSSSDRITDSGIWARWRKEQYEMGPFAASLSTEQSRISEWRNKEDELDAVQAEIDQLDEQLIEREIAELQLQSELLDGLSDIES